MSTRRNMIVALIGALVLVSLCRADASAGKNSSEINRIQNLNGTWNLATDPRNEGKKLKWSENPPEKGARSVRVPEQSGTHFRTTMVSLGTGEPFAPT